MITLYADPINGVLTNGDDSFVTDIVVDEEYFFQWLSCLSDDDYIRCEVSFLMYVRIKAEYGITEV